MDNSRVLNEREIVRLLGVKIDSLSLAELISEIQSCILTKKKKTISYVNVHALNIAYSTPWFREFLNKSYLTFCDGFGVSLAARLIGKKLHHRFTPPDFIEIICEKAAQIGWKIFFLGAKPGVAQRAADKLRRKFPHLQIKTHHGYFDKDMDSLENRQVVEVINAYQPELLVLGFGMPLQEKWIVDNMESLDIKIAFPAGALFDYVSGELFRAPRWVTDSGFEWLGRLLIEPRRLWRRYVIGNPLFFLRLFIHHFLSVPMPR